MVEPADDGRVLMQWTLRDGSDGTVRRIRAIDHEGKEGSWKTILETRIHTDLWVENATIGYADSLDDIGPIERPC